MKYATTASAPLSGEAADKSAGYLISKPVAPGTAFFTAETRGSPTIRPKVPGSLVPRAEKEGLSWELGLSRRGMGGLPATTSRGEQPPAPACGKALAMLPAVRITEAMDDFMMKQNS